MTFNSTAVTSFQNEDSNSGFSTNGCIEIPSVGFTPCNNPADLISVSTRAIFEKVINVFILPIFCVVGVTTNVISCAVFYTQGLRDRINMCLFSLALADLIYIVTLNVRKFGQVLDALTGTDFNNTWGTFFVRYRLVAVHTGFAMVSNLITITIALERCVCVVNPFRAARLLRTRFLATVLVVLSVIVFAGMQFVAFKYDVVCAIITRPGGNSTGTMARFESNASVSTKSYTLVIPSKLYRENTLLMDVLDTFVFSSVVPVVSLLVIVVATSITIIKLKAAASWRMAATAANLYPLEATTNRTTINQKEAALTRMLVVISCVHIVCVSPGVLRSLARFMFAELQPWGRLCNIVTVTEAINSVLLALNSTVSFFVYYAMGSKFKDTLRRRLRCPKETATQRQQFFHSHMKLLEIHRPRELTGYDIGISDLISLALPRAQDEQALP